MNTNSGFINRYEMQERLGQRRIAEVWKAFDTHVHRYVAIKILHANLQADPEFVTRFQRDLQVIASFRHPNIVQYYDFSTSHLPEATSVTPYTVIDLIRRV